MTDHEFKAPERTARAVSKDGCGYNLYEPDGSDYPCDRPAVGYRWYQVTIWKPTAKGVSSSAHSPRWGEHEDLLDVACEIHRNAGGDRMAELMAEVERLTGERDRARGLAARLEEQVARVEALAVVVANRMMATAKPSEIWAALRGEGACEGSPMCPGGTHAEGCYSLAWTAADWQQCTDSRCLTPCMECAEAALTGAGGE